MSTFSNENTGDTPNKQRIKYPSAPPNAPKKQRIRLPPLTIGDQRVLRFELDDALFGRPRDRCLPSLEK